MQTFLVVLVNSILILLNEVSSSHLKGLDDSFPCGVPEQGIGLIVGGDVAEKGDFPWVVALLRKRNGKFFCGAVLISQTKILTAAHCIQLKNNQNILLPREVVVLLGVFDLKNSNEPGTISMSPSEFYVHPDWNPFVTRFDADIALILIETEVTFTANIIPICMFDNIDDERANSNEGIIVGYGQSEDKTKMHEFIPKKLKVAIKLNDECFLENYRFAKISSNRTFCAGAKDGMGACKGDSGSGLFIKKGSAYFLKGIVSSSLFDKNGDCDVNNYAVYTSISMYLKWIEDPYRKEMGTTESPIEETSLEMFTNQPQSCGIMNNPSGLVQGGTKAITGNFPWTVAIFVRENVDLYELKAVGSLISNLHILALANPLCANSDEQNPIPINVERLKMYFGIDNLKDSFVPGGLIVEGASKIILHPELNLIVPRSADLAIIFLQSPIFITNLIFPVCLWNFDQSWNSENVRYAVVGWGVNEDGVFSEFKKYMPIDLRDQSICRKHYHQYRLNKKYLCAGGNRMTTPCEFDDALYMKVGGSWYIKGLINTYYFNPDMNKCSVDVPVLFEDISLYSQWVLETIKWNKV